jgi:hypothetical protein
VYFFGRIAHRYMWVDRARAVLRKKKGIVHAKNGVRQSEKQKSEWVD